MSQTVNSESSNLRSIIIQAESQYPEKTYEVAKKIEPLLRAIIHCPLFQKLESITYQFSTPINVFEDPDWALELNYISKHPRVYFPNLKGVEQVNHNYNDGIKVILTIER